MGRRLGNDEDFSDFAPFAGFGIDGARGGNGFDLKVLIQLTNKRAIGVGG